MHKRGVILPSLKTFNYNQDQLTQQPQRKDDNKMCHWPNDEACEKNH